MKKKEGLLQDIEKVSDLKIEPIRFHKEVLINVNDLSLRYEGAERELFTGLRFQVKRGDRIILSGENGSGKSSILKAILQKMNFWEPETDSELLLSGNLDVSSGLTVSYVSQDTSFLTGSLRKYCETKGFNISLFLTILRQLDFGRE